MHTKKDQHILNKITIEKKLEKTSVRFFAQRGLLVEIKDYWYITENEMPHVDKKANQYIARLSDDTPDITNPNPKARKELYSIIHKYNVKGFRKNIPDNMSVSRYHVHLFK